MSQQAAINENVQERLRALECQQQIMTAFFYGVIETHPQPEQLKQLLMECSEMQIANANAKPIPDDWIRQAIGYRQVLLHWLDRRIAENP
jgi:hypothetical protein